VASSVALVLRTTGLNERTDGIFEIGAVRFEGGAERETFHSFVFPGAALPEHLRRRHHRDLIEGAPDEGAAAKRLIAFLRDDPVVVHDVRQAERFLERRAGVHLVGRAMDVAELARFCRPTAEAFDLESLCLSRAGPVDSERAALDLARAVAVTWCDLIEDACRLPLPVLSAITTLLEPTHHPLRPIFEDAEKSALVGAFDRREKKTVADLLTDCGALIERKATRSPRVPPEVLDTDGICADFGPDGILARALPAYERRGEQARMASEVCQAFNTGSILLCEAGTGTGKSLAYLLPAIRWAWRNREPVVVSTNTKNLQAQLFDTDLPLIEGALGEPIKTAVIKGRANYLCVRKFLNLLEDADRELDETERALLPPIITWAAQTETGDIAENNGFLGGFSSELWSRLTTRGDECLGPRCPKARFCFIRRARALSLGADIVVANHSVVFSELGLDSVVLPPYKHVIFDEAHNVERVATEHLAMRAEPYAVTRILNRLHRGRRDGAGRGLFTNIRFQLSRAAKRLGREAADIIDGDIRRALDLFAPLDQASGEFFNSLTLLFLNSPREADKVRYRGDALPDNWAAIQAGGERLCEKIRDLVKALGALRASVEGVDEILPRAVDFSRSLVAESAALSEFTATLTLLLRAEEEGYVYWAEQSRYRRNPYALCAAPLDIGPMMNKNVYSRKSTIIFTSATLAVDGGFHFMRDRLGLGEAPPGRIREINVGSSFDFDRQVLFVVPMFLPEPGPRSHDFADKFAEMAIGLLSTMRGRGLALYTSYRMLNDTQEAIREALGREGIRVLAQGIDGARSHITRIFQRDVHSVLLGTQSFWEGVDVAGEALSCLILAKLPFHVFTEPIIEARCEMMRARGQDPFIEYTLPSAIIRLKQGFGRLIRTRTDRGIICVADRRVATRGYGRRFLNSLPARAHMYTDARKLLADAQRFMAREPDRSPDSPPSTSTGQTRRPPDRP